MCKPCARRSLGMLIALGGLLCADTALADDLVEIQVRQTETDAADFITWTAAPCRIRIRPGAGLAGSAGPSSYRQRPAAVVGQPAVHADSKPAVLAPGVGRGEQIVRPD